ncbi:MAG TPA: hypothetical protein VEW47_00710 [Candidatus Dormibacteraeota bacterium]|nr:hypothetical protein [Candidatus Dormibacteraeota bacterium]
MPLDERNVVSEHVLEIRYRAFGALLDIRGRIADAVAAKGQMSVWSITDSRVDFKPTDEDEREIGFVSHRNIGYVVRTPDTRQYMHDRAMRFIRDVFAVDGYKLPDVVRFGFRSQILFPTRDSFAGLLKKTSERMPQPKQLTEVFDAQIEDYGQIVVLKRGETHIRVRGGPMQSAQAKTETSLGAQKDRIPEVGFFLDLDHWRTNPGPMDERKISALLQQSNDSAWKAASAYHDILI